MPAVAVLHRGVVGTGASSDSELSQSADFARIERQNNVISGDACFNEIDQER
jgi:hypothetical protein